MNIITILSLVFPLIFHYFTEVILFNSSKIIL
nr:MAG TPA: hypothetical protein [Crassvirales sp.]DAT29295.1 MAG TPA: hypothetical protein [Caudoviricetes sp.]